MELSTNAPSFQRLSFLKLTSVQSRVRIERALESVRQLLAGLKQDVAGNLRPVGRATRYAHRAGSRPNGRFPYPARRRGGHTPLPGNHGCSRGGSGQRGRCATGCSDAGSRLEARCLFDVEHQNASENTAPGRERNWRATAWEIHPITSIEVGAATCEIAEFARRASPLDFAPNTPSVGGWSPPNPKNWSVWYSLGTEIEPYSS
jgi:hypothetical protein